MKKNFRIVVLSLMAVFSIVSILHAESEERPSSQPTLSASESESLSESEASAAGTKKCVAQTEIKDIIGPATIDVMNRVEDFAQRHDCGSILLLINTPGGSLDSTRMIVEKILNSKFPYLCLVAPTGGHAGSAGAIILQACHINGALSGTNLGAATPISSSGEMPKDLREKILNDTRSWLESVTRLRGRSEKFGRDIILEAKAVAAEDALKLKGIDFVGASNADFLKFAEGKNVKMNDQQQTTISVGEVKVFELDVRYRVLSLLTDPQFAYMLLLGSLALLYFEITHAGVYLPGVLGGVGLIVALLALNKLDVQWAGLALIFFGVALLIAEMFLPTMGVLGLGGVASLFLGSVFLFDPVKSGGYHLPYGLITSVVGLFAIAIFAVSIMFWRTRKIKAKGGFEDIMGEVGVITKIEPMPAHLIDANQQTASTGWVEVMGEIWKFESHQALQPQDRVIVTSHEGLILKVKRS